MARYGLAIDISRCTGCDACIVACKSENSTRPGVSWIRVEEKEEGEFPRVSRSYTPRLCMQCGTMPCAEACPTGAIYRGDGGVVLVDPDRCDCGAGFCLVACPFDALSVNEGRKSYFPEPVTPQEKDAYEAHRDGAVEKCTLCHHRITAANEPACVHTCPSRALIFGDLEDQGSNLAELVARGAARPLSDQIEVDPSVFYII